MHILKGFGFLKLILGLIVLLIISLNQGLQAQGLNQKDWVDSVFNTLSDDERLGQLFMVAAYSNKDERHYQKIDSLVKDYNVGGLIFFQGGPKRQALLNNRYQSLAKVPLLVGIDGEWGLSMRLDSTMFFPKQMTLGAIQDEKAPYSMGVEVAKHCKRMGIHINFAPVVDVNNNPDNPVIGTRSFGEVKEKVAQRGIAYMQGMQQNGVAACAKHFPGHGDTDADSHFSLPVIKHDKARLNNVELYPFKKLISDSLLSIMVAHIHIPAYDNRPNIATTLSPAVVTGLLKGKLHFKGLVFTDALNMKGVSKYYGPGEVEVMALIAGNDVLLFSEDVGKGLEKIKEAINSGKLFQKDLDERVKKILGLKYWVGLNHNQPVDTTNLFKDLNSFASKAVQQGLYEKSTTLIKNTKELLPIKTLDHKSFASVSIGLSKGKAFHEYLDNYVSFRHFYIPKRDAGDSVFNKFIDSLSQYNTIIVSLNDLNNRKRENFGISSNAIEFIKKLQLQKDVVVILFGNPYALGLLGTAQNLICAYEDNEVTGKVVPQMLFGALRFAGKLPVTVSDSFKEGIGIQTKPLNRLRYCYPENIGIASERLLVADSILTESIKNGSDPGSQLVIAKDGAVIYKKNFGYQTYDKTTAITSNTLYDLASVTKAAGTLQSLMFLYDWGKFNPDSLASYYLPELKETNKKALIIRDILVHQAGLVSYLDYWRKTMKNGIPDSKYYSNTVTASFPYRVSSGLYSAQAMKDSIWRWTVLSPLAQESVDTSCYTYKYSDLTFYFMKRIAEKQLGQPLEEFLVQNLYSPLGLKYLGFNPLLKFPLNQICPTEEDHIFRNGLVQGTVHDQGAAMVGGIAGHAGLFSNAQDLAILGQMNLQGGYYGGIRYFKESTIKEFSRQQYLNNRRALGWDRPFPPDEISLASSKAYGHTGFTGTAWWIDPEYNLVFVLLSNRTYPFADNKRYNTSSVRTKVLNEVYNVIKSTK